LCGMLRDSLTLGCETCSITPVVRFSMRPHKGGWRLRLPCGIFAEAAVVIWAETCSITRVELE